MKAAEKVTQQPVVLAMPEQPMKAAEKVTQQPVVLAMPEPVQDEPSFFQRVEEDQ
jgi:hypothetical protein